ncbi:T7SS effector LXG polymorphic toxin [Streptococcus macacae]|uniref:LXG domain-containing protein n=1 Tax=Streptococcus macacae NCTC 11558 TaxID=764298 RepID=G5JX95_9STRE|nr:T7SS effector LXG polymorphic toxin [Streptococcus macacae]EHJ51584.1 hypothetical protein STRMA_1964 [Streptococcus macacae NCTC 11558]SUN77868.1 membrane protein [Streptococcus macacae NCTC 11558]
MVKMVLGSSDTQASSVGTLADNYKAGFEQLVKSIDQLANEDRLSGSAYSNIKNYGSSVVKPLAQAFVLLAEAAKADIKKLPDEYRASVGSEDLDEETLTAQIHALNSTLATNRATKTAMKRIDSAADTQSFDQAISADEGTKRDLEEKLRKLREYNAKSSGFFSDIAGLESAVNTGLSQLQSGISGFNGTFTLPSKKELAWTKTIKSQWEKREAKLAEADLNKGAQELAKKAGISYEEALDWMLKDKVPSSLRKWSKNALKMRDAYITYKGEKAFINGRKIVVDSKGRVRMGSNQINLYNRDSGRVYKNRTAKTFQEVTGETDIRKTNIGRGVQSTGWKNALKDAGSFGKEAAKENLKNSLNPLREFKGFQSASKWAKGSKILGAAGTVINVGSNIKENFFDDKTSSMGKKIRNFSVDTAVDLGSGAGAAYAGAAVGTMIGGPVGTVVGAAVGMGMSWLMNRKWSKSESSSLTGATKVGLKALFGG